MKLVKPASKEVIMKSRKENLRLLKSQESWQKYQTTKNRAVI